MPPLPNFGDLPPGGTFGGLVGQWPTGGGGYFKKPPAPLEPDPGPPLRPVEEGPKPEAKPKVILKNLAWAIDTAVFNDKVGVSLEADVPPSLVNIAKVEIKAIALLSNGKREAVDAQPIYLKEGKASGQVTVFFPAYRENGNLPAECEFVFTAKHRDSDEAEGPRLKVKQPFATHARWDKPEEWFGLPVKLLANTILADGTEVTVKVASENGVAFETQAKAANGKLEIPWVPCLCGVAAEADGTYPEKVEYYAELSYAGETAAPAKNFFLKTVGSTEYHTFSKECRWGIYGVHAEFRQRIAKGEMDVQVSKTYMKAWQGFLVDMTRAKVVGSIPGCPYELHRWGRITGIGGIPDEYFTGEKWEPMPKDFKPRHNEFFAYGFIKSGTKFVQGGLPSAIWPDNFDDYDFDAANLIKKRNDWKKDTDSRWSRKYRIRPKSCQKGLASGGCGYPLGLQLDLKRVDAWQNHTLAICSGKFRSNTECFSLEEKRIAMVAHEIGHLVGMPDEYSEGGFDPAIQGDGAKNGIDSASIMGQDLGIVKKRHYGNFSEVADVLIQEKAGRRIGFQPADI